MLKADRHNATKLIFLNLYLLRYYNDCNFVYILYSYSFRSTLKKNKMAEASEFISKIPNLEESDLLCATVTPLETLKMTAHVQMKSKMELFLVYLQATIVNKLSEFEPEKKFFVDKWDKEKGGGGISCVLQDGKNIFLCMRTRLLISF